MSETPIYDHESRCVCIHLRHAARKITSYYDNALQPSGITAAQYAILINLIKKEGCGTGELAKMVNLEKSTLVRNLRPLLANGLIEDKSTSENRARKLFVTTKGKEAMNLALPLWKEAQLRMKQVLNGKDSELVDLLECLESI